MPRTPIQRLRYRMMRIAARMMPSCKDVSGDMSRAMDERLPVRKRLAIRLHVAMCSFCRRYEEQIRLLRSGAEAYAEPDRNETEEKLSSSARDRIRGKLAAAARAKSAPPEDH